MRSALALLALPALALAAPPTAPTITRFVFAGTGCNNDSGSVKADTTTLGDTTGVSFSDLKGDDTDNCGIHVSSSGGSAGWQVAVREITYEGNVDLRGNSQLNTYTTVFWSDNAASTGVLTGSLTCTGPQIKDYVTVRSSTADLKWSKCTGPDGNPGILNVNFRPVVQGDYGTYDFKHATWKLEWRKC